MKRNRFIRFFSLRNYWQPVLDLGAELHSRLGVEPATEPFIQSLTAENMVVVYGCCYREWDSFKLFPDKKYIQQHALKSLLVLKEENSEARWISATPLHFALTTIHEAVHYYDALLDNYYINKQLSKAVREYRAEAVTLLILEHLGLRDFCYYKTDNCWFPFSIFNLFCSTKQHLQAVLPTEQKYCTPAELERLKTLVLGSNWESK